MTLRIAARLTLAVLAVAQSPAWSASPAPTPLAVVDQFNEAAVDGRNGAMAPFSFGQSFTPRLGSIDSAEFLLSSVLGASAKLRLREGVAGDYGFGGALIDDSLPASFSTQGDDLWVRFSFEQQVALQPGQQYVLELLVYGGDIGLGHSLGNRYAGGQFLQQGIAPTQIAGQDLLFREGLASVVPEPGGALLAASGALLIALRLRRRAQHTSRAQVPSGLPMSGLPASRLPS